MKKISIIMLIWVSGCQTGIFSGCNSHWLLPMDILRVIIPFRQVGKKGKLDPALTLHETLYEHPLLKSFFTLELRKKDSVIYYLKFECTYISNVLLGK